MNNDNATGSSQGRKNVKTRRTSLRQYKEISKCENSYSHLNLEQNKTVASSASSLTKVKSSRRKSKKSIKKMTVESNFPLCNLTDDKNVTSSMHQKGVLHKIKCSLPVSNKGLEKSSSQESIPICSKLLNVDGIVSNKKSDVSISSEEITNLLCSVSLSSRESVPNDGSLGISKEQINNVNTNVTFSPLCSSQDSCTEDLNNSVVNIIETLAEENNDDLSKRLSNSSIDNDDSVKNILKGVIAYVEVRSGHENRTKAIERELHRMGAKIVPSFLSTTTHVIFKDGKKSTRDKAVARNIPLVSVLWVESCKQQSHQVPEADFPAVVPEIYDSPLAGRRIRKLKSMQPKDFNVEFAGSIERLNKIFSRIRQDNECYLASDSFGGSETSASVKGDDTASDDDIDHTPSRCKIPVTTCRLFDSSVDENKIVQLENKKRINEIDRSSRHKEKNPDSSALLAEVTIKRRKLFSDLNQSPQLVSATPNSVKKNVKSSSTSKKKKPRSKAGVAMSVKLLTNVKNENLQIENNICTNSSVSCIIDKCTQHEDEKSVVGENLLLTKLKQSSRNSLDDFSIKRQRKEKSVRTKSLIGNSFDSNSVDNTSPNKAAMKRSTIVLTSLQSIEREVIYSIIESLGGFRIKNSVTEITTHVVSGDNRRTLSVLFGLVRGCWLLSSQWVYQSMEAGHWLEEEPFQLTEYFQSSQVIRLERANHRPDFCQNLFGQLGNIFVSSQCSPSSDDITELIRLSGGKVSNCLRKCEVLIGPHTHSRRESKSCSSVVHLSEKWILDCISQNKILPSDEYKI